VIGTPLRTETWTREQRTGFDGQGVPQFGAQAAVKVRPLEETDLVRTSDGEDERVAFTLQAEGDSLDIGDRVTPPGGSAPDDSFTVLAVEKPRTPSGRVVHTTAEVG